MMLHKNPNVYGRYDTDTWACVKINVEMLSLISLTVIESIKPVSMEMLVQEYSMKNKEHDLRSEDKF